MVELQKILIKLFFVIYFVRDSIDSRDGDLGGVLELSNYLLNLIHREISHDYNVLDCLTLVHEFADLFAFAVCNYRLLIKLLLDQVQLLIADVLLYADLINFRTVFQQLHYHVCFNSICWFHHGLLNGCNGLHLWCHGLLLERKFPQLLLISV